MTEPEYFCYTEEEARKVASDCMMLTDKKWKYTTHREAVLMDVFILKLPVLIAAGSEEQNGFTICFRFHGAHLIQIHEFAYLNETVFEKPKYRYYPLRGNKGES